MRITRSCKTIVLICMAGALSGCAYVYDQGQDWSRERCEKMTPHPGDVKACQAQHRESFEDYERRRKKEEPIRLGPKKDAAPAPR